jgi:hypothetical protein
MVWSISAEHDRRTDLLQDHLVQTLSPLLPVHDESRRNLLHDVARSVSVYCTQTGGARAMPSDEITALFSRALWGVGEAAGAARVLQDGMERRAVKDTLLALLPAGDVSPWLWQAVVRGVIRRHGDWLSTGGSLWRLDWMRIEEGPCALELLRLQAVDAIVQALVPVWQPTSGRGALGIHVGPGHAPGTAEHLHDLCRSRLRRAQDRYDWTHTPDLMRLA